MNQETKIYKYDNTSSINKLIKKDVISKYIIIKFENTIIYDY